MSSVGQRGKWAEGQVAKWMKARSEKDAQFAYNRYPDARAGSLQSAPSDFEASCRGVHYKVEVKEVTIPPARATRIIPAPNFAPDKVARMYKWALAGDACWVLVCHLPMKEWRLVPLRVFTATPRPTSWDVLSFQPYKKLDDLMQDLFDGAGRHSL